MPRTKNDIWNYFASVGSGKEQKCVFCGAIYKCHITRMANHLKRCKRCPKVVTEKLFGKEKTDTGRLKFYNILIFLLG